MRNYSSPFQVWIGNKLFIGIYEPDQIKVKEQRLCGPQYIHTITFKKIPFLIILLCNFTTIEIQLFDLTKIIFRNICYI